MYPLDIVPVLLGLFFAWVGWTSASPEGYVRVALGRAARNRRQKNPVLFWCLVAFWGTFTAAFLAMMMFGFVFMLAEPPTIEHVRTVGKSFPSGTYSRWSFVFFMGGGTVLASSFLREFVRGVRSGLHASDATQAASTPTKERPDVQRIRHQKRRRQGRDQ